MRLLLVTGIYQPDIGGPATHTADLRSELLDRGHDVVVLTLGDDAPAAPPRRARSGDVVRLARTLPWPARLAMVAGWIAARRSRFDAVYATGMQPGAVAGARVAGIPVVVKVVGDLAWERGRRLGLTTADFDDFRSTGERSARVRAMARLQNATLRAADAITAPSDALADTIRGWLRGPAPIEVTPNGVARPEPAEAPATPTFAYVGRLIPHKRVDRIVEAVASVDDARLEVVGDGPERDRLIDLAGGLGVEDRVAFHGALAHHDVMRTVAASSALVLASDYEGLPHVVIEALASGVPVISPAVGGVAEVVTDGRSGLILADASVGTLAAAIGRLAADADLERKLRAGALETGAEWTIERTAERILALLDRAIAGRPRAVFLGGSRIAPPTPDVVGRLDVLASRFRATVVGTGSPGVHRVGTTRTIAVPRRPGVARLALGSVAAVAAAAGRRSAIVCQSPYEAVGVEALARILPRSVRPGVVVEVHGDWRTAGRLYGARDGGAVAVAAERLATRALARADRVRAVGNHTASLARAVGYEGVVDRFPAFADYAAFSDEPLVAPPDDAVAFAGALERVKGVDVLVDAWSRVRAARPGAVLRLAGAGALGDEVRRRAAALEGVQLLGALDPAGVRSLLDRSTIVVVPSRSEGLGRVILEASARARPVVATAVGGIPELVDDGSGALVPHEDPEALAAAIVSLLGDPARAAAMGQQARRRFEAMEPARAFEDGMDRLARWIDAR